LFERMKFFKENMDPLFSLESFPASRVFTMDIGKLGMNRHLVRAMIEVDVTDARKKIKQQRKTVNERVSFTPWILKCIAKAVSEYPQMHAIRRGRTLVLFHEVDISILVEKKVEGKRVPIPLLIRDVSMKSMLQLHTEIKNAVESNIEDKKKYVMNDSDQSFALIVFLKFPQFIRLIIWRFVLRNPQRIKKMMGTIVVTSVGMMGKVHGWFIPSSIHPLSFALGSIVRKPGVVGEQIQIREFLHMTILIDHDVVDGAPAARFVARLVDIMQKGYGINN